MHTSSTGTIVQSDRPVPDIFHQRPTFEEQSDQVKKQLLCPHCGGVVEKYVNPFPTVDIIIEVENGIVLIKRKNPPYGWALPGGFVDYGESLEAAAVREAREETSLEVDLISQFGAFSDPKRDPRKHTITVVFIAKAEGKPVAADDAAGVRVFNRHNLPNELAFDHGKILKSYFESRTAGIPVVR